MKFTPAATSILATAIAWAIACAGAACSGRPAADASSDAGGGSVASEGGDGSTGDGGGAEGDAGDAAKDAPDAHAAPTSCPNAMQTTKNGYSEIDLERPAFVDTTDVTVVFCNPLMATPSGRLVFLVVFTDHAGLPPSDATHPTWIATDAGTREDTGFAWDGTDLTIGEHHAGGLLSVPATLSDGMGGQTPVVAAGTQWMELHLDGIGSSGADLSFRWTKEYLP